MERVYEDRKDQLDSNIYIPVTDGHLGYNVPVNMLKCKETDGAEIFRVFSKVVMFTSIDDAWREHLREMDDLRQSVQNATYEQKDPLLIYKFESFGLFSKMLIKVNREVLSILNRAYIPVHDEQGAAAQRQQQRERAKSMSTSCRRPGCRQRHKRVNKTAKRRCPSSGQENRPQRPLSMRLRQEVQELCHGKGL